MSSLRVRLFGQLAVWHDQQTLDAFVSRKVQELFCYLLIYNNRSHPRDVLATLLWGDSPTAQAKKSLRHALWQLQTALQATGSSCVGQLLQVELEWVQLHTPTGLWVDALVFEQICDSSRLIACEALGAQGAIALAAAVDLYQGDLLEGWYQDWCLQERERFQQMYLTMLDKLVGYSEANQEYEAGLGYANRILRVDRARERTHRQLMRLYYLAGDRTTALRQFERCIAVLDEELGVRPSQRTQELYDQIRADRLVEQAVGQVVLGAGSALSLRQLLAQLTQLYAALGETQQQIQQQIRSIQHKLRD